MRTLVLAASCLLAVPAFADEPHTIAPELGAMSFLESMELDRFTPMTDAEILVLARHEAGASAGPDIDGPLPPDVDEQRIRARKKRFKTRYKMQERTLGFALQPAFAMLQGSVVAGAFDNGFAFTARFIAQVSPINQLYVDLGYSRHDMKNPRAMFFRTAVTDSSGFSGTLQVINPAVYFAQTFPIGAGFHSRSLVIPKLYVGLGAMFTIADGTVTNSGIKGTVTGEGTQPFVQFTPGFATDVRILEDFFVGFDLRYRLTLPTTRPNQTKEFTIPKLYVFEPSLSFAWMFY